MEAYGEIAHGAMPNGCGARGGDKGRAFDRLAGSTVNSPACQSSARRAPRTLTPPIRVPMRNRRAAADAALPRDAVVAADGRQLPALGLAHDG